MAFPESILDSHVELLLGGVWTDITDPYVYGREGNGITITYGRPDEGRTVDSSSCSFELDNSDGRFSRKNPNGPYYGLLKNGTPVRVSVLHDDPYLYIPGAVGDRATTPDNAALDIVGDIDVRIDCSLDRWFETSNSDGILHTVEIIGKWQDNQESWFLATRGDYLYFQWSANGSTDISATSTASPRIAASNRLAIRVTLDVDNGASGNTVTFYTAPTIDGPWTVLGEPVVTAGVTSIFNSTSALNIGDPTNFTFNRATGKVYKAEVRSGINGTAVANPDFTAQAVGATSFVDAAGRTWSMIGDTEITNRDIRFYGNVASWPVRWQTGGNDIHVQVVASGPLRRLGQGSSPLRSSLYREFTSVDRANIVAYWPMEDGSDSASFASAIPGDAPMSIVGDVSPAAFSEHAASGPLPTVANGVIAGAVSPYTVTGQTSARMFVQLPSSPPAASRGLFVLEMSGTAVKWIVWMDTSTELTLRAYDDDGTQIAASATSAFYGTSVPTHVVIELTQDGADIDWNLIVQDVRGSLETALPQLTTSGTLVGYTAGRVNRVRVGGNGDLADVVVGHAAVADSLSAYANTTGALLAWRQELAINRFRRLMTEEGQDHTIFPGELHTGNDNYRMGSQGEATLLGLARSCEDVSGGILYEQHDRAALVLRDASSLYQQAPAIELDYDGDDGLVIPLEPDEDDQLRVNDFTATRVSGASYRVQQTEGVNNINFPEDDVDGVGPYEDSDDFDLFRDAQVEQFAAWKVFLGTRDEARYSQVRILLQNAVAMIPSVTSAAVGDILTIDGLPTWVPPGQARQMIQGYTEFISQYRWEFTLNCSPSAGFDVGEETWSWADTGGSELAEALTTTETDVDIITDTDSATWTDDQADSPYVLEVGGETIRVDAPGGLVSTNPFFDANVTGWTGSSATLARSTTFIHPHPDAVASMLITPAGGVAAVSADSDMTAVDTITPGGRYQISGWFYSPAGWSDIRPSINWYTNAGAFISTTFNAQDPVGAGAWTYLDDTVTAPATAGRCVMRARIGGTPAATDILYAWGVRVGRLYASAVYDEFGRTATDSWGLADSGQTWSNSVGAAANFDVAGGFGTHTLTTANVSHYSTITAPHADFDIYADVALSALPTGGPIDLGPVARWADASNFYQGRISVATSGVITLAIIETVGGAGAVLGSFTTSLTFAAGTFYRVRFQGTGTTLRARAWATTAVEPGGWQVSLTDSSLTAAGSVGCRSRRDVANTNVNPVARFDNFKLVNPQTFAVTRSFNGIVKSHSAGDDIALNDPARAAL